MNYPLISIIIATYNSEKTLPKTLESISKQKYPKDKIEILVIDGGSRDQTKNIAKKYNCKIINNPKREPLNAKYLGYLKSKGKYIIYLDSDEVLENPYSIKLKYLIFKGDNKIKSVIPSGYKVPANFSPINYYINEFGDPFSFFIYRLSKDEAYFTKELLSQYKKVYENKAYIVFDFYKIKPLPFLELGAMGTMTDLKYFKQNYPQTNRNLYIASFLFYYLNEKNNYIAVAKKDAIFHYSSDTLYKYLKKIRSRVRNNVYQTSMGRSGFLGRDKFQPLSFQLKRYLFIPYSLTIIFPLIDSIIFAISRKRFIYLIHPFLCIYTVFLIIYYYCLKLINIKPNILSYGN